MYFPYDALRGSDTAWASASAPAASLSSTYTRKFTQSLGSAVDALFAAFAHGGTLPLSVDRADDAAAVIGSKRTSTSVTSAVRSGFNEVPSLDWNARSG